MCTLVIDVEALVPGWDPVGVQHGFMHNGVLTTISFIF